jgi:hypothetical protein
MTQMTSVVRNIDLKHRRASSDTAAMRNTTANSRVIRRMVLGVILAAGLASLSGCVVYTRPAVYACPAYTVYEGPEVVYVHGGYYRHYR